MSVDTQHQQVEYEAKLASINSAEERLHEQRKAVVAEARVAGFSWEKIGDLLGTTRQAAWQRFSDVDKPTEASA